MRQTVRMKKNSYYQSILRQAVSSGIVVQISVPQYNTPLSNLMYVTMGTFNLIAVYRVASVRTAEICLP